MKNLPNTLKDSKNGEVSNGNGQFGRICVCREKPQPAVTLIMSLILDLLGKFLR